MNTIKKIDIHAHVVPKSKKTLPNWLDDCELLEIYGELNIEKGVILPFLGLGENTGEATNENAALAASAHPDRFVRFVSVDLTGDADLYGFLKEQKELGAVGVGEITSNIYFDDERVENLFSVCEKLGLPVLFHISPAIGQSYGIVDGLGLPRLEKMLEKHPNLKFIGHSQPFWCEIAKIDSEDERNKYPKGAITEGRLPYLLRKFENLYCDLSAGSGANAMMRDPDYAVKFLNEFSDRILYGCDICTVKSTYPYTFAKFLDKLLEDGKLSEDVYKKICRDNAVKLLNI